MKNLNKKLYTVIVVCLLLICFSVGVLATNSTDVSSNNAPVSTTTNPSLSSSVSDETVTTSAPANNETVTTSNPTNNETVATSDPTNNETVTTSDPANNETVTTSAPVNDETVTTSNPTNNEATTTSDPTNSEIVSTDNSSNSEIATNSDSVNTSNATNSQYSNNTSKNSYSGNVGGYENDGDGWDGTVSDGDVDGWTEQEEPSSLVSIGTTQKGKKNIGNGSFHSWVVIILIVSIVLMAGSISALVYVNRKEFLQENNDDYFPPSNGNPPIKNTNYKNNHKNRTNIYKPRD